MRTASTALAAMLLAVTLAGCGDNSSPATAPATPNAAAPASTAGVTAALQTQADALIKDVGTYIKENKWDLADKGITQLEGMKPQLPPEDAPKIDDLRKLYTTAKNAVANMPASMPAMKLPG